MHEPCGVYAEHMSLIVRATSRQDLDGDSRIGAIKDAGSMEEHNLFVHAFGWRYDRADSSRAVVGTVRGRR